MARYEARETKLETPQPPVTFMFPMKKLLFVGDINVDVLMGGLVSLPVIDREITCSSFDIAIGSSAVICAAAFASLGGNASFLGLAGSDDYGEFMLRGMKELR